MSEAPLWPATMRMRPLSPLSFPWSEGPNMSLHRLGTGWAGMAHPSDTCEGSRLWCLAQQLTHWMFSGHQT